MGQERLAEADFQRAATALGCEVAVVKTVCAVESRGSGFLPDDRPIILFEAHYFSRLTKRAHDVTHPLISSRTWNKTLYKGGAAEWDRMATAIALNRDAALRSASWGLFQIMGDNFKSCGFGTAQEFVNANFRSEGAQLDCFVQFVLNNGMAQFLRDKNWAAFARRYNGPGQVPKYTALLSAAYLKATKV